MIYHPNPIYRNAELARKYDEMEDRVWDNLHNMKDGPDDFYGELAVRVLLESLRVFKGVHPNYATVEEWLTHFWNMLAWNGSDDGFSENIRTIMASSQYSEILRLFRELLDFNFNTVLLMGLGDFSIKTGTPSMVARGSKGGDLFTLKLDDGAPVPYEWQVLAVTNTPGSLMVVFARRFLGDEGLGNENLMLSVDRTGRYSASINKIK